MKLVPTACLVATIVLAPAAARALGYYEARTPCRIVDTRLGGGALAPGQTRELAVVGGGSFAAQGGSGSGCGVPGYLGTAAQAQAVVVNLTVTGATGAGHLTAWPGDQDQPLASVINYNTGVTVANGLILPLAQDATPGADLRVRAAVSATHLIVDVVGYFVSATQHLWGEGRPGTIRFGTAGANSGLCSNGGVAFGLSETAVSWGESARACPTGTWVCTAAERGTAGCDTARPSTAADGMNCAGTAIDWAVNSHRGWTADVAPGAGALDGHTVLEGGFAGPRPTCEHLPVWCCSRL